MSDASRSRDLAAVRVIDLRALRVSPPPHNATLPATHGGPSDPRYPSPTLLRSALGIVIDMALHLGIAAVMTFVALRRDGTAVAIFFGTFLVASIVHRIVLQRISQTTLGKSLTGLRLIREDTGGKPTVWLLTRAWWIGLFTTLAGLSSL